MSKLKDVDCRNAKPTEKPWKLRDGAGLYLYVTTKGSKLWRMDYSHAGKEKTLSFGAYPTVTLAAARAAREAAKLAISEGRDPGVKEEKVKTETFEELAQRWFDNEKGHWKDSWTDRVWARIERDLVPEFGHKAIDEIEAPEILAALRKVEDRGALDIARRLQQHISQIFRFAIAEGKVKYDPAAYVTKALKPARPKQHMAKLPDKDIPTLVERINAYQGDALTRLSLLFTLHSFARTREVRYAEWSEIEGDIWRIPPVRMKMGREHIVPLTTQVQAFLEEVREISGQDRFIFPGKPNRAMSENTMLYALYRMGYHSRLTVHGFRGMASTVLNEAGWPSDHIERQLAHAEGNQVRGSYNSAEWLPSRRKMMQWWSDGLSGISRKAPLSTYQFPTKASERSGRRPVEVLETSPS